MESVLLLNASFEPMRIISWKKAVCMFFSGKVEVIEEYDAQIRSVSVIIAAPSVVRLLEYVQIGKKLPALTRANILARDRFRCQYCDKQLNAQTATIDHIIPRSLDGKSTWKNLVCCCSRCNRQKGCLSLKKVNMKLLKKPIKPNWLPIVNVRFKNNVPTTWIAFLKAFTRR